MIFKPLELELNESARGITEHIAPFDFNSGLGLYENYLTIDMAYDPIYRLRMQLEKNLSLDLSPIEKERGKEAHITVVTSHEFWSLSQVMSSEELHKLARERQLQSSPLQVIGLGQGSLLEAGLLKRTFFLVIESLPLREFRQDLQEMHGVPSSFIAKHYYPHITIGYTHRDLHFEDGVFKDSRSLLPGTLTQ